MIAPSEKHLEDWIVDNQDKVQTIEQEPDEFWDGTLGYIDRVIKRQCRFPSGVCDLVVMAAGLRSKSVAACELKKGVVDSKAVAQCLRYIRDLREIFLRTRYPRMDDNNAEPLTWDYDEIGICSDLLAQKAEITGLIIGHSVPDENLLIACEASNITVLTYDFDGNGYSFKAHGKWYDGTEYVKHYDDFQNFSYGAIGDAMREVIKDRYDDQKRWEARNG